MTNLIRAFLGATPVREGEQVYDVPKIKFRPDVCSINYEMLIVFARCSDCGSVHLYEPRKRITRKGSLILLDEVDDVPDFKGKTADIIIMDDIVSQE